VAPLAPSPIAAVTHAEPAASGPAPGLAPITWADPARQAAFEAWLDILTPRHGLQRQTLAPASADASFRRYFRLTGQREGQAATFIVMDAPPAVEDNRAFVDIAALLRAAGLNVPQVLDWQVEHGFLLVSDLGQRTYHAELLSLDLTQGAHQRRADGLYRDAIGALVSLQGIAVPDTLPRYDAAMVRRELDLFPEWYIHRHQGMTLDDRQQQGLNRAFEQITQVFTSQAQVLVHRDFHSRNLMVCAPVETMGAGPAPNPGLLDFQGAVLGPVAYDLVSLLRDAYLDWDEAQQIDWAARYWERARQAGVPVPDDFGTYWRDLEWTGLQRHLKVLGIFARLSHRDGKHGYLDDLPRVWRQAHHVAMRYSVLTPLARLLEALAKVEARDGYTF
jgi:N-acetylmuramate 1-kinase